MDNKKKSTSRLVKQAKAIKVSSHLSGQLSEMNNSPIVKLKMEKGRKIFEEFGVPKPEQWQQG